MSDTETENQQSRTNTRATPGRKEQRRDTSGTGPRSKTQRGKPAPATVSKPNTSVGRGGLPGKGTLPGYAKLWSAALFIRRGVPHLQPTAHFFGGICGCKGYPGQTLNIRACQIRSPGRYSVADGRAGGMVPEHRRGICYCAKI